MSFMRWAATSTAAAVFGAGARAFSFNGPHDRFSTRSKSGSVGCFLQCSSAPNSRCVEKRYSSLVFVVLFQRLTFLRIPHYSLDLSVFFGSALQVPLKKNLPPLKQKINTRVIKNVYKKPTYV